MAVRPDAPTTIVVLPEYVARHWWDRLLYNQTAKRLKAALVGREHTVIADVPYRRSEQYPAADRRHSPATLYTLHRSFAHSMIGGRQPLLVARSPPTDASGSSDRMPGISGTREGH